eukprot:1194665-Prorocentrum_minimum.AAC.1
MCNTTCNTYITTYNTLCITYCTSYNLRIFFHPTYWPTLVLRDPRGVGFNARGGGFRLRGDGFTARVGEFRLRGDGFTARVGGFRLRGDGFNARGGGFRLRGDGFTARGGGSEEVDSPPGVRGGGFRVRGGGFAARGGGFTWSPPTMGTLGSRQLTSSGGRSLGRLPSASAPPPGAAEHPIAKEGGTRQPSDCRVVGRRIRTSAASESHVSRVRFARQPSDSHVGRVGFACQPSDSHVSRRIR